MFMYVCMYVCGNEVGVGVGRIGLERNKGEVV